VRRKDKVEAQSRSKRDRWIFYETINIGYLHSEILMKNSVQVGSGVWYSKRAAISNLRSSKRGGKK